MPAPPWHEVLIELIADEDTFHIQLDGARLGGPVLLLEGSHAGHKQHGCELDGALNVEVHVGNGLQELAKSLQDTREGSSRKGTRLSGQSYVLGTLAQQQDRPELRALC